MTEGWLLFWVILICTIIYSLFREYTVIMTTIVAIIIITLTTIYKKSRKEEKETEELRKVVLAEYEIEEKKRLEKRKKKSQKEYYKIISDIDSLIDEYKFSNCSRCNYHMFYVIKSNPSGNGINIKCWECGKAFWIKYMGTKDMTNLFSLLSKYEEIHRAYVINYSTYPWEENDKYYIVYSNKVFGEIRDNDTESDRKPISQSVQDRVWRRDGGKCVQCGSLKNLEFDHIIPVSKGGSNTYRNIQLLCEKCNREKSNKIG